MANLANALLGGITGGMCDSMLGRGTIEFRPTGLLAIGRDGRERPMYRADYRGGGSRVDAPAEGRTTFTHMNRLRRPPTMRRSRPWAADWRAPGGGTEGKAAMANTAVAAVDTVAAQQWTLLGTSAANGGMDVYVAPASFSIRRSGDRARSRSVPTSRRARLFEGKPFLSARNEYEYDCARPRQRMLGTTGYSGLDGQGNGRRLERWRQPLGTGRHQRPGP